MARRSVCSLAILVVLASLPACAVAENATAVAENATENAAAVAENATEAGGGEDTLLTANFSVAMMLLASVTYMMTTFCFVNHSDKEIQEAAWQVMNGTISIFSAVLFFQGVNEVVAYYFNLEEAAPAVKLGVNLAHALVWYVLLQCLLAYVSRAVSWDELCHKKAEDDPETDEEVSSGGSDLEGGSAEEETSDESSEEGEEIDPKVMKEIKLDLKCWAVLMGHVTGFACINAFGTLQIFVIGEDQMNTPSQHNIGLTVLGGPVAAMVVLQVFYTIADTLRRWVAEGDDGKEDEYELLWDEETEETEDDVLGLTVSFTSVQVMRFAIAGIMPNEEGEVEDGPRSYTHWQCAALMGAGFTWFAIHILRASFCHGCLNERRNEQFKVVAGMVYAWCFFFAAQWVIHTVLTSNGLDDESFATVSAVVLALVLNVIGYTKIFILDKIADAEWSGEEMDKSIRNLIDTVGILIGFSWEKAFDAAVVTTAKKVTVIPTCVTKLSLSIVVCGIVIPAWRWYILPKLWDLGYFEEEEEEESEKGSEEGSCRSDESPKNGKVQKGTKAAGADDKSKPLLSSDERAQVRAQIDQFRQKSATRITQLQALKVQVDSHAEDAKRLPAQIKQVLEEVGRARQTLSRPQ